MFVAFFVVFGKKSVTMIDVSKIAVFFVDVAQQKNEVNLTKKFFCHKMNDERKKKSIKEEIMFSDLLSTYKFRKLNMSEHNHRRDRNIYDVFKNVFRFRKSVAIVFAVVFSFTVTASYASPQYFEIEIADGDNLFKTSSQTTTVGDLLKENGIELTEYDSVYPKLNEFVSASQTVVVNRVNKVTVKLDGETKEYYTSANTVGDFIKERGIDLNYHDSISLPLDTKLNRDTKLEIVRVIKRIVKVETEIPYATRTVSDTSMSISDSKIITKGVNGIDCQTYEVILQNGVEISRELVSKERTREPVTEVKAVGAKGGKVTKKGDDFSYSKVITCNATAYDLSFQSCGKRPGDRGYGITASGTYAKYGTVAVDPRVIPLGTRMYIESADGSFVYGYCVAEDTGGAIKGNKVDLFFNSYSECMQFGRRNVNVYILD